MRKFLAGVLASTMILEMGALPVLATETENSLVVENETVEVDSTVVDVETEEIQENESQFVPLTEIDPSLVITTEEEETTSVPMTPLDPSLVITTEEESTSVPMTKLDPDLLISTEEPTVPSVYKMDEPFFPEELFPEDGMSPYDMELYADDVATISGFGTVSGECGADGDNLTWTLVESTGVLTISGTGDMDDYSPYMGEDGIYNASWSTSPWNSYLTSIKSVVIEKGVTSIGEYAFYRCYNLASASIPEGITKLGSVSFYHCSSLTEVIIPNTVISIGNSAFSICRKLCRVTIPDSVSSMGVSVFSDCSALLTIGGIGSGCDVEFGWTEIPDYAFNGTKFDSIDIPEGVTSIGKNAFCADPHSTSGGITELTIPSTVTSIGDYAFRFYDNLSKLTIHSICNFSLTAVFCDNSNFKSAGSIGSGSDIEFAWTEIPDSAFATNTYYSFPNLSSVTLSNQVTSIGSWAFNGCSNLSSVSMSNGLKVIGSNAFRDCTNLVTLTIPDSVSSIGQSAFYSCEKLTNITIPTSLSRIEHEMFSGCSSLKTIEIPDSVVFMGYRAFDGCSNLEYVNIPCGLTDLDWNGFRGCPKLLTAGSIGSNSNIEFAWIDEIPAYAFYGCDSLASITIPDTVTRIGEYAFNSCESLNAIIVPDKVTEIGEFAFEKCTSLRSVTLPYHGLNMRESAFSSCTNLSSVKLSSFDSSDFVEEGLNYTIGKSAFSNCEKLTNIAISKSIKGISINAFNNCSNLSDVYYMGSPSGWDSIGIAIYNTNLTNATIHYAEEDVVDGLEYEVNTSNEITITSYTGTADTLEIPSSVNGYPVTTIAASAFENNSTLTSITIPSSVTAIEDSAFRSCSKLATVDFKNGTYISTYSLPTIYTNFIGANAFSDNKELVNIIIPSHILRIGSSAFQGCSNIVSVSLYGNTTTIEENAFLECTSIAILNYLGTETQWEQVSIDDGNDCLKNAVLLCDDISDYFQFSIIGDEAKITKYLSSKSVVTIPFHYTLNGVTYPVTSIGSNAFSELSILTDITIPNTITSIGTSAFSDCSNLDNVYYYGTALDWNTLKGNTYSGNSNLTGANVTCYGFPAETLNDFDIEYLYDGTIKIVNYKGTDQFVDLVESFGEAVVSTIGISAFSGNETIESVIMPNTVTSIEMQAFYGCTSLLCLNMSANIESIGYQAFGNCTDLVKIWYVNSEADWNKIDCSTSAIPTGVTIVCNYNPSDKYNAVYMSESEALEFCRFIFGFGLTSKIKEQTTYKFLVGEYKSNTEIEKNIASFVIPTIFATVNSNQEKLGTYFDYRQSYAHEYIEDLSTKGTIIEMIVDAGKENAIDFIKNIVENILDGKFPVSLLDEFEGSSQYDGALDVIKEGSLGIIDSLAYIKRDKLRYLALYTDLLYLRPTQDYIFECMDEGFRQGLDFLGNSADDIAKWATYLYYLDQSLKSEYNTKIEINCPVEVEILFDDISIATLGNTEAGTIFTPDMKLYVTANEDGNFSKTIVYNDDDNLDFVISGLEDGTMDYSFTKIAEDGTETTYGISNIPITENTIIITDSETLTTLDIDHDGDNTFDEVITGNTEYQVTFDNQYNNSAVTSSTTVDKKLKDLPNQTRDDYTFDGWFDSQEEGSEITTDTIFSKATTVYAQWTLMSEETPEDNEGETPDGNEGESPEGNEGETPDTNEGESPDGNEGETPEGNEGESPEDNEGETPDSNEGESPDGSEGETPDSNDDYEDTSPEEDAPETDNTPDSDTSTGGTGSDSSSSSGSSSGSSSSSTPTTYTNSITTPENGTVTLNPTTPEYGDSVTLTVTPNSGYEVGSVSVKRTSNGSEVTVTKQSDGTYRFTQPYGRVNIEVEFVKIGSNANTETSTPQVETTPEVTTTPSTNPRFSDISTSDWFYDAVEFVSEKGLMNGTGEGNFSPYDSTTRGMVVTVLHSLAGYPEPSAQPRFHDVESGEWFANAVTWANENQVANGMDEDNFSPNGLMTREQLVVMLYGYEKQFGKGEYDGELYLAFNDNDTISEWAEEAVAWSVAMGIVGGRDTGDFDPQATANRAEVAIILKNFVNLYS